MTRLAFLRSIETQQTRPFLKEASERLLAEGITPVLIYTEGDVDDLDFTGDAIPVDPDIRSDELVSVLRSSNIDVAVSVSIPDNSSLRDAAVRTIVEPDPSPRVVAHPIALAATFADKHQTKQLLAGYGLSTPPGVYVDGDLLNGRAPRYHDYGRVLAHHVERVGFPVIVKPIWDCLANGMSLLRSQFDLESLLDTAQIPGNVLIEKCLDGRLCSVEVIASGNAIFFQPIVWKGSTTGGPEFAFEQVRVAGIVPAELADTVDDLTGRIRALCAENGVHGALEFEFIEVDGEFHCIEVNPRVSGSTGMSIAASGVNTYLELARMGLDRPWVAPEDIDGDHVAWQIPVSMRQTWPLELPAFVEVVRDNTFTVDGREYATTLLRSERNRTDEFARWCRGEGRPSVPGLDPTLAGLAVLWESMAAGALVP